MFGRKPCDSILSGILVYRILSGILVYRQLWYCVQIPAIIKGTSKEEFEVSKNQRNGFLSALSRQDFSDKIITNDQICFAHFISGMSAYLLDMTNPDWLSTLNPGHVSRKL